MERVFLTRTNHVSHFPSIRYSSANVPTVASVRQSIEKRKFALKFTCHCVDTFFASTYAWPGVRNIRTSFESAAGSKDEKRPPSSPLPHWPLTRDYYAANRPRMANTPTGRRVLHLRGAVPEQPACSDF